MLEDGTILEFPYIYYPGYKVTIDGKEIKNFESENGFLAISLTETSKSEIVIEYVGTKVMFIAKIISIIGLIILIIYVVYEKRETK